MKSFDLLRGLVYSFKFLLPDLAYTAGNNYTLEEILSTHDIRYSNALP